MRFLYKFFAPKITKPNVIREKLQNLLLYKKRVCKMLMKLTTGVDFTKLCAPNEKLPAHSAWAKN